MTSSTLENLPSATTPLTGTEFYYAVQSNTDVKVTGSSLTGTIAPVFNVKNYGATGNGVTDDTSSINSAIAALNTAGAGRLYFPSGTYIVSSSLTTITANSMIFGDGCGTASNNIVSAPPTRISFSSSNTPLFTVSAVFAKFRDINLHSSAASPTSGSAGVLANGGSNLQAVNYDGVAIDSFYRCVDTRTGITWTMHDCWIINPAHYGIDISNTVNADAGDWCVSNTSFVNTGFTASAAINQTNSGGGKINNCKFNAGGSGSFSDGILANLSSSADINISNCSIENITTGISISNCENVNITGTEFLNVTTAIALSSCTGSCIVGCTGVSPINADSNSAATLSVAANQPASLSYTGSTPNTQQFILSEPSGSEYRMTWIGISGRTTEMYIQGSDTSHGAQIRLIDSAGALGLSLFCDANDANGLVRSQGAITLQADGEQASGGSDAVIIQAGGFNASQEVVRFLAAGNVQFTNSANFTANGATAASLGSTSPGHGTVQKWLTISDGSNTFYIPCF